MFMLQRILTTAPASRYLSVSSCIMAQKRAFNEGKRHFKKSKKQKLSVVSDGSNEDVLLHDIRNLLGKFSVREAQESDQDTNDAPPSGSSTEIDLTISSLSSTGDGLAVEDGHVYVVPFTAPGDVVKARAYKHFPEHGYTLADFVSLVTPSSHREGVTPPCQYFAKCSGCQFQHLPYSYQLAHKRGIVEKAFANFSQLPASAIPKIGETIGSPLQYGYRTKLTPHFDAPPNARRDKRNGKKVTWTEVPPIGYMLKGTRKTMDIEDCVIGTEAVRKGLNRERIRVAKDLDSYQRGATLLLRENTQRILKPNDNTAPPEVDKEIGTDAVLEDCGSYTHRKTCITDARAISSEYVEDFRLDNPAGAFFQNNNSILPLVTQYIRDNILGTSSTSADADADQPQIKYMIDAYCGSGFFTITLSTMFSRSIGIDVSAQSIDFATTNARLNNLPLDSTRFIAADANALFETLDVAKFPPDETVVVIDPSRKGCDENFVRQLLNYAPRRICYVSCNVHTQARDVGWLVGGLPSKHSKKEEKEAKEQDGRREITGMYEIESLRGFDFFPQTSHVEGVAMLKRRENTA